MNDSNISKLEDLLQCPICISPFTKPIITTRCSHTFCYSCISQISSSEKCPVCRANTIHTKHRFRNLALEKVLDLYRSIKTPEITDFSDIDQLTGNEELSKNNPEKPRFYLANTIENEDPSDIDYRKCNEGWHLACVHEVEYYQNDVKNLIYDWYIVVLDGGTFDCRIRGNKIVYDPKAHFGHGHPNPTDFGSYGAALISKTIKTSYKIQSRQEPISTGWRRVCTHEASRNSQKIKDLVLGQTFDDEIAVLGGFIKKTEDEIEIVNEQDDIIIGKDA